MVGVLQLSILPPNLFLTPCETVCVAGGGEGDGGCASDERQSQAAFRRRRQTPTSQVHQRSHGTSHVCASGKGENNIRHLLESIKILLQYVVSIFCYILLKRLKVRFRTCLALGASSEKFLF